MQRATSLIHTSEIKSLPNLPPIILVLIFVNVKTLIMLMLLLEQACGRPTWSLRATWCPQASVLVTPGLTYEQTYQMGN